MRNRPNRRRKARRKLHAPKLPRVPRVRVRFSMLLWPVLAGSAVAAAPNVLDGVLDQPVGCILSEGTFRRVRRSQAETAIAGALEGGFGPLDVGCLRWRLEGLPWVGTTQLRPAEPYTLIVRIAGH